MLSIIDVAKKRTTAKNWFDAGIINYRVNHFKVGGLKKRYWAGQIEALEAAIEVINTDIKHCMTDRCKEKKKQELTQAKEKLEEARERYKSY